MKTKYILRIQKIGSQKVEKKECHTKNICSVVRALGKHGYHVINYYEYAEGDTVLMNLGGEI